jgi:hypothetical protein
MLPRARKDNLTIRELPEETLVYDQERHKGHCLNATAALVWQLCDGQKSVDELARVVAAELGIARAVDVVELALEQLDRRHLLAEAPRPEPIDRLSRREALRKLTCSAVTLPLVMTVATKTPAQSLSTDDPPASSSSSTPVQLNLTVPVTVNQSPPAPSPPAPQPPAKQTQAPVPCRTRGQSCLASASGQQGTCCTGLRCTGVAQGAGVCG